MKSLIPTKGLAMMFPAKGGRILGPLGNVGLMVVGIFHAISMLRGNTELPPALGLLLLVSLAVILYSVQCNPKGTKKSPYAL
ncbi:hypothetical protein O9X98_14745 [Agrobacterium salinitolerans]|nr:hypothetical protein [Agrobacterium salinitolerans]